MHKIHNIMLVLFELRTWCWYAHYLSAIRTRSRSGDSSNLHLVLLPFNQLPQIEHLYRIGTVARTLASCTVWDVKLSHERYGRFGITLSKAIEEVVGEYGSASFREGWFLDYSKSNACAKSGD